MYQDSLNVLPWVTKPLPYAFPYYNRQFLRYSTHDHFPYNFRCITVHVTMHSERNICNILHIRKYIFVTFSTGYQALHSILSAYCDILNVQNTHSKKMLVCTVTSFCRYVYGCAKSCFTSFVTKDKSIGSICHLF